MPVRAWFEVTDFVWLWRHVLPDGKDDLFPGATGVALVLLAVFASVRRLSPELRESFSGGRRWLLGTLAAVTAISLTMVVYVLVAGPWRQEVGAVVLRVSDIDRPLMVALVCGAPFVHRVFTPGVRDALARRSPFVFYSAATIAMAVLACGPVIPVGKAIVFDYTPYHWLMYLPGFDELRVPSRFWMLGVLCLAIAAGLAYARFRVTRLSLRILVFLCASAGVPAGRVAARNPHGRGARPTIDGGTKGLQSNRFSSSLSDHRGMWPRRSDPSGIDVACSMAGAATIRCTICRFKRE